MHYYCDNKVDLFYKINYVVTNEKEEEKEMNSNTSNTYLKKEINSNKKYNNSYLINVKSFISYS